MLQEAKGDLWTYPAGWRVVTTNGVVSHSGNLIMGAGNALEAKKLFPGLPAKLGAWVDEHGNRPFICREEGILTLPTKRHWQDMSNALFIRDNVIKLVELVDKYKLHHIVMPRPGCGNGGLTWGFVAPYIDDILDERFTVISP